MDSSPCAMLGYEEHFPHPKTGEIDPKRLRCTLESWMAGIPFTHTRFDYELSRIFKGIGDVWRLTDHCQTYIRDVTSPLVPA